MRVIVLLGEVQKRMYRTLRPCLPLLATILLAADLSSAADPSWKSKPVSKWDVEDAKQLLAGSPWVKQAQPHWLPDLSRSQREEGGNLTEGIGGGVGIEGTGVLGSRRAAEGLKRAHTKPEPLPVMVRWKAPFRAYRRT